MAWAPDYCTSSELKAYVRIPDSADDVQIALAITAASRAVDQATNRQFGLVASAEDRYYTARWDRRVCRWFVDIDDLMTATGLTVKLDLNDDQTWSYATTQYVKMPVNYAAISKPWTTLSFRIGSTYLPSDTPDQVQVHASFGWTAVPTTIKQATMLQASRLLARRDSPFGVAGSPEAGNELRLLAKVDPDVDLIVRPYARWWGAV